MSKRRLLVMGPNGSGKTTLSQSLIAYSSIVYEFLNADEIASALAPLHPESVSLTASKLLIKRLKTLLEEDKSLAIETTGAGTNYLKHLKEANREAPLCHMVTRLLTFILKRNVEELKVQ